MRATARTCLTLIWIGRLRSVWTLARRGLGEIGGDELGQTQRRRYGSKKTDYDADLRFFHLSECRSWIFCAHKSLYSDLRLRRLPLRKDKALEIFPRLLGFLRVRPRMRSRRRRSRGPTPSPTKSLKQCQHTTPLQTPPHRQQHQPPQASSSPSSPSFVVSSSLFP